MEEIEEIGFYGTCIVIFKLIHSEFLKFIIGMDNFDLIEENPKLRRVS